MIQQFQSAQQKEDTVTKTLTEWGFHGLQARKLAKEILTNLRNHLLEQDQRHKFIAEFNRKAKP